MILRKLEVYGFKSFADRQVFSFAPGITAVIGPNGCGKSNVVDAFKWVLGEQAPSSIRSKGMADVLHLDREGKEAVSYAEGSITFDNTTGFLCFDAPEVVVTRRIHRDGRSEYLINNTVVRLRMVRDLFMGTGIGTRSYFVLEQGRITDIIKKSPVERRAIFEEAAGIGRYNKRRQEAERKLSGVDDSLSRIHDVVSEITRQIRSLRIQAGRARSYNEGASRLRELRIRAGTIRYFRINEELLSIAESLGTKEGEERRARDSEQNAVQLRQSSQHHRQLALEAVHRYRSTLQENVTRISTWREKVEDERDRVAHFRQEAKEKTAESQRLESALGERRIELDAVDGQLEKACCAKRAFSSLRLLKGEELEDALDALHFLEDRLESLRRAVYEKDRERAQLANQIGSVRVRRGNLEGSLDRLSRRSEDLKAQLARVAVDRRSAEALSEQLTSTFEDARDTLKLAEINLNAARVHLSDLDGRIAEDRINLRERQGRLGILKDLEASREGVGEGARFLLNEKEFSGTEPGDRPVFGLLGEHLEMDPVYARAIEQALGGDVEALLIQNLKGALEAADTLKRRGKGGVRFWPVDEKSGSLEKPEGIPEGMPGVLGWAPDLVREREQNRAGILALLRDVILVKDRDSALRLRAEIKERSFRLVTLDGEIFGPFNRLVAGESVQGGGLIRRRIEVQRVEKEIESLLSSLERLKEERCRALETLSSREEEMELARRRLREQDLERVKQTKEVDDLCKRELDFEEEMQVGNNEAAEINEELEALKKEEQSLEEEIAGLEDVLKATRDREALLEASRSGSARMLDTVKTEMERVEAVCAGASRREEEIHKVKHQILERFSEMDHSRGMLVDEAAKLLIRADRLEEAVGRIDVQIQETTRSLKRWEGLLDQAKGELATSESRLEDAIEKEEKAREALDVVRTSREEDRVRQGELKIRLESLKERLAEEENIDITEISAQESSSLEAPDGGEKTIGLEELDQEVAQLKRKLDRLGPVNAQAIVELEELEKREVFYQEQESDLAHSKRALEDIIRRINKRSRQMFLETFNTIRSEFRNIFRKLFGGGRGDIRLLDEDNVLESGVEIVAQPPEKGAKSLDMLSGGEKVMTTTALLFAIFRARPCPFCLLDEIDAALDEANVQRFLDMVGDFLAKTQFIIVTHNKRTIAEADVIHGITMPKAGRSQRVSVRFEDGKIHSADRTAPVFAIDSPEISV